MSDSEDSMQSPLKLGFFIQPVHPLFRPYGDVLREDREAVVLADRLGYREAFIGEHLVDSAETITSCLAFIANLADACPSITFGTAVLPLANYHPAMAAAHVAMVDHMLEGRFTFGIGPGGLRSDMEVCGNLDADRNAMFVEAIDQILAIWAGDAPYNLKGRFCGTAIEMIGDRMQVNLANCADVNFEAFRNAGADQLRLLLDQVADLVVGHPDPPGVEVLIERAWMGPPTSSPNTP